MLLTKLTALFSGSKAASDVTPLRTLELACAALMFEVARSDFTIDDTEREAIRLLLTEHFSLSEEDVVIVSIFVLIFVFVDLLARLPPLINVSAGDDNE